MYLWGDWALACHKPCPPCTLLSAGSLGSLPLSPLMLMNVCVKEGKGGKMLVFFPVAVEQMSAVSLPPFVIMALSDKEGKRGRNEVGMKR